jgi:predicted GH43/DUF377 family glycosyl hydrolase
MKWKKKGLIYKPDGSMEWSRTHAQIPTPIQISNDILRVYFATRNSKGKTQTGYVDLDIENPSIIKNYAQEPVIKMGKPGLHDDSGAMPFCVFKDNNEFKFYYTGWHIPMTVAYDLSIALATSKDIDNFNKISNGPLISKNVYEPYWAAAPCVIKDDNKYKMWYISCYDWININNKLEPVYNIKYAESVDGVNWKLTKNVAIKQKFKGEALGRPWVIKENGIYKMWYSSRGSYNYRHESGEHYVIGYAESLDGKKWNRIDEKVGIEVSESGWDSEMIEYASVFKYNSKKYMFYNGNGFGRSGFGYAVLEEEV